MNNTLLAIDIGSAFIHAVIAKHDLENNINILGTGTQKSAGVNKGLIVDIEEASKTIKNAVNLAKKSTTEPVDNCVVSISGSYSKSLRSSGSVNVPNGLITETEINQVMQMALYNATIVPEYEVVHVIPIYFKVDDSVEVDNPLNMNGSRLEVSVFIVTAKRTALTNIKSALNVAGFDMVKFVLDGYASAIAVLDEQQKKFGSTVINMGATTTEFITYKANSLVHNGFIPVGSNHITNDLSVMLHTPPGAAEKIKLEYGSITKDYTPNNELGITKVKIPRIGDEDTTSEVALDYIQTIIHARVEEDLVLVKNQLKKSGILDNIGSGIVITGGLSNLDGIKKLAEKVFDGIPISLSMPKNIKNGFINFDEPTLSTIMGLLQYSLGTNRNYQLDSSKKLVKPIKKEVYKEQKLESVHIGNPTQADKQHLSNSQKEEYQIKDNSTVLTPLNKEKKKGVSRFWNKVSEWF
ncbi:cell division protein FtsA [Malaciobacter pacificus]|uniref:Cell division protein FtsA n=1 Tax=Malaciobacter pacificus TaxID=1080223 RepID=A0A5C2H603_9BACT|nr:cell division protein FtsA [Malaciobacter pacificus]QEP34390.1 cell division protein FtsA [Malaciobacter pacificus]GGD37885.1 cell division protein FtsA [Malaciobacter pacificus]